MNIKEIIKNKEKYLGEFVVVEATLIAHGDRAFITDESDPDKIEDSTKITIGIDNLKDKLSEQVACWVGGNYLYQDNVVIEGKIEKSKENLFELSITDVKSLIIKRDDKLHSLKF